MFTYLLNKSEGPFKGLRFLIILLIIFPGACLEAKEKWSLSTSLSYSTGKYIYDTSVDNYTFYLGGNYRTDKWSVSLTVPVSMQRDKLDSQTELNNETSHMDEYSVTTGIPGVYVYGEYIFFPSFFLTGQLKIPTSSSATLFSSGEFDYSLGLAFRRMFGSFKIFADAGYLVLGDPAQFTYKDPLIYGLGIAKHAEDGRSSVSFYFQGYDRIISGLDPPQQISAAYYRLLTDMLGISFYGSKGIGETSADYTFSLGFNLTL